MLDRVREACFGKLQMYLEDAYVLDLFSGTGSLGLEALSRGAAFCRMIEKHGKTTSLLSENVRALGVDERADVICGNAISPLHWASPEGQEGPWADLIFLDPPYPWLSDAVHGSELVEALGRLTRDVLRPDGLLIFHTPRRGIFQDWIRRHVVEDHRIYGNSALWYIGAEVAADDADELEAELEGDAEVESGADEEE